MSKSCVAAVALLSFGILISACVSTPLSTTERVHNHNSNVFPGGELTVVTLNMLHGFSDCLNDETLDGRLDILIRELSVLAPDIVLLQEASVTPERKHGNVVDRLVWELNRAMADSEISYNAVFYPAHGSRLIGFYEGSAILSRYEISGAESVRYTVQSRLPPEGRIALRADIRCSRGLLTAVSTHITNVDALRRDVLIREYQVRELSELLVDWSTDRIGIIVGGDFNATPDSSSIEWMNTIGAIDAWPVTGEESAAQNGATSLRGEVTNPDAVNTKRIDYIFTVGDSIETLLTERILDTPSRAPSGESLWVSDHAGIFTRLRIVE